MDRIKIIFGEDSYFHVEHSEATRIRRILEIQSDEWISLNDIARLIRAKRLPTEWTILKLAGAKCIVDDKETIAEAPILTIQKESFNQKSNYGKRYLRPTIRIKLTMGEIHK